MRQKGNSKALWPLLILVNYYLLPTVIGTTYGFPNDNHDHLAYYDEDGNPVSSTTSAAPPVSAFASSVTTTILDNNPHVDTFSSLDTGPTGTVLAQTDSIHTSRGGFPTSTTSPYSATTMYIADSATIISNHPSPSSSPSLSPTAAVHNVLEKAAGIPRNASHLLQPYDDAELPPVDFQHRGLLHIVSRPADPFINIFRHGDSPNNTNNPSGSNQTFKTDTLRASSTMELEPSTVEHDRFLTGKMSSAQMRRHIMLSPNASPVATVAYLVYGYSLDCALTRFPHDWSPNNDLPLPNITEWHETIAEMQRQNVKKQSETLLSAKARVATDAEREIYIHQGRVLQSGINHVEAQKTELDARENDLDAREKKIAGKEKKLDGQLLSAAIKLLNADKVGKQADKIMQKTRKRYRDSMMSDLSKQHRTETTDPCSNALTIYLPPIYPIYPRQSFIQVGRILMHWYKTGLWHIQVVWRTVPETVKSLLPTDCAQEKLIRRITATVGQMLPSGEILRELTTAVATIDWQGTGRNLFGEILVEQEDSKILLALVVLCCLVFFACYTSKKTMTPDPCRPPAHEPTNPNASDHDHEPVDPNAINDEQPSRHQEPESHDSQWKRQDTSFIARSLLKHGKGSRSPSPVNWDELLSRHVVSSQSNAESVLSPAVTVHPASKQELDGPVSSAPSSSRPRSTPPVQRSARRRIRTPSPRPSSDGELVMELFDSGTNSDSDAVASPVSRLFRRRIRTPLPPPSSDSALELSDSDADADCDFDFGSVCSSEKDVMMPVPLTHATTTPAAVASPRTTGTNGREAAAGDRPATYPSAVQTAPPSQLLISFESDPITERDSGRLSSPTHTVDERPIQPTVASAADASVRKSPPFQKKWKPTHPSSTKMSSVIDNSSPTRLAPIGLKEEKVSKGPNVIQSTIAAEARPLPWEITDEQHDTLLASVTDEYPFGTPEARAPHEAAMSAARSNGVEWVIPLIPTLSSRGLDYGAVTFSSQPYRPKVCHGEAIVKPHDGPMYDSCTHAIDESDSQYGFKCDSLAEYYAMYQWSDDEDERDV